MAVIRYKCTVCDRNIEIIEQPTGLERIGPCVITDRCRGSLYKIDRLEDYVVGRFPEDVSGLTNYIRRNVLYDHTQAIAEQEWLVEHNLGVNPSVQVVVNREETIDGVIVDTRPEIEPQLITLIDANTLTILFDRPESGLAQVQARSSAFTQTVEAADPGITYLPVSQSNILTIAADLSSNQFPEGTTVGTCSVRIYYLDQETLDETAFESAVFKDYNARAPINTSAWNDASEIFVNGQLYTVLTIDIGDPVEDIGAPSAGTVLFQEGTSTVGFAYDQSPNMVVLLSKFPHTNSDKVRNELFRPDLNVGPVKTLDSFIFADGEISVDQTKVEDVFPPVFTVTNPQDHPVTPVVATGAYVLAFAGFGGEGDALGVQYTSDNDIDVWTGVNPSNDLTSPAYTGAAYASSINTWAVVNRAGWDTNNIKYSTDDGATWTQISTTPTTSAQSTAGGTNMAWSPTLGLFLSGGNAGILIHSPDGISWSVATDTPSGSSVFGTAQMLTAYWAEDLALFLVGNTSNEVGYSADGDNWTLAAAEPGGASSADVDVVYAVGSRIFVGRDNATIYYSDNLGDSWTQSVITGVPIGTADPAAIAANSDGSVILIGAPGLNSGEYVWRSTDNGVNFASVDVATQLGIADMYSFCLIYDPDYGFIIGGRDNTGTEQIIVTSDDGLTWTLRLSEKFLHTALAGSPSFYFDQNDIDVLASKNQV